jgi:hypothetical protein
MPLVSNDTRDIEAYVEERLRGPFALTSYNSDSRPNATNYPRSLIYDGTDNSPMSSDVSGNWRNILSYTTGTATGDTLEINALAGKITTDAETTGPNGTFTITLTNSFIEADDLVFVSITKGTDTTGAPILSDVLPGDGTCTIVIRNLTGNGSFNGTFIVSFLVVKA